MPLAGEYEPSPSTWVRDHVAKYENSNGIDGASMGAARVIILTTVGAETGKLRKAPLMRIEKDGAYAVVASDNGSSKNPGWYFNALAHPKVQLQDGSEKFEMVAHEAMGNERLQWWARALESNPQYADFQAKVTRTIPLLVLENPGSEKTSHNPSTHKHRL